MAGLRLLESAGFGDAGRWSVYAARPRGVFEAMNTSWRIRYEAGTAEAGLGDPLARLARLMADLGLTRADEEADGLPFRGGLIGYFGYDLAPHSSGCRARRPATRGCPTSGSPCTTPRSSSTTPRGRPNSSRPTSWTKGPALERRWEDLGPRDPRGAAALGDGLAQAAAVGPRSREAYLAAVGEALDYIAAGDIFQVNLSQRLHRRRGRSFDPLDLYLRLKTRSPAPFAAFLRWDDLAVVSASPESFYQTRGDRIVTRPIKGTRRGAGPAPRTSGSPPSCWPRPRTAPS